MRPPGPAKKNEKTACFFIFARRISIWRRVICSIRLVGGPGKQFLGFRRSLAMVFAVCVGQKHWFFTVFLQYPSEYIQVFLLSTGTKKICKYREFCDRIPEAKKHRKYQGFGFQNPKNIGIYGVFCTQDFKSMRNHILLDDS